MKTFLLDFDGVIFHNPCVRDYIVQKSIDYVKTRSRLLTIDAEIINKKGYEKYGHTALIYGKRRTSTHLYNHHVFAKHRENIMELVDKSVGETNKQHLKDLIEIKQIFDYEYVLCTNTPLWYCEYILTSLDTSYEEMFGENAAFTSDNGLLKPTDIFYDHVEEQLHHDHYVLIDDSILNIHGIQNRPNWTGHHVRHKEDLLNVLI